MRTHDPPPYTAPHERIEARQKWEAERDAREAALEAKYGVPLDELPSALASVLAFGAPKHPRRTKTRRFNYRVYDRVWRVHSLIEQRRRGVESDGWRTERRTFLAQAERFRLAEIEVRKQRAVKKGRGKPLPKNHFATRRNAIEKREFREKNW